MPGANERWLTSKRLQPQPLSPEKLVRELEIFWPVMSRKPDLLRLHHENAPKGCQDRKERKEMKYILMMTGTKAQVDWYAK